MLSALKPSSEITPLRFPMGVGSFKSASSCIPNGIGRTTATPRECGRVWPRFDHYNRTSITFP